MKRVGIVGVAAALGLLTLAVSPAAAQGTFNAGARPGTLKPATPAAKPAPLVPQTKPADPAKPRAADPPEAPGFKPYEPHKPKSLFGPEGKPRS